MILSHQQKTRGQETHCIMTPRYRLNWTRSRMKGESAVFWGNLVFIIIFSCILSTKNMSVIFIPHSLNGTFLSLPVQAAKSYCLQKEVLTPHWTQECQLASPYPHIISSTCNRKTLNYKLLHSLNFMLATDWFFTSGSWNNCRWLMGGK